MNNETTTWMWRIGFSICTAIVAWVTLPLKAEINKLDKEKVDKELYNAVNTDIQRRLGSIEDKVDQLITMNGGGRR